MTSSNSSSAKKRPTSSKSKRSTASKSAVNAKDDVIRIDDNAALLEALGDTLKTMMLLHLQSLLLLRASHQAQSLLVNPL